MIERHYKTAEVAELLGFHEETVRRLAQRGDLRSVKIGRELRFPESGVQEFLDRHKVETVRRGPPVRIR